MATVMMIIIIVVASTTGVIAVELLKVQNINIVIAASVSAKILNTNQKKTVMVNVDRPLLAATNVVTTITIIVHVTGMEVTVVVRVATSGNFHIARPVHVATRAMIQVAAQAQSSAKF